MDEPRHRPVSGAAIAAVLLVAALAGPAWEVLRFASVREDCLASGSCAGYAWGSSAALALLIVALAAAAGLLVRARRRGLGGPPRSATAAAVAGLAACGAGIVALEQMAARSGIVAACRAPLDAGCRARELEGLLFGAGGVGLCAWGAAMLGLAALLRRRARRARAGGA